jgi:type II secretory pathway component PulM
MAQPAKVSKTKQQLEGILRSPTRLRAVITIFLVGLWYFAIYQPAVTQIDEKQRQLDGERKRLLLASNIEDLRNENDRFRRRFPTQTDQNAAVQYLIEGVRAFPLKLTNLDHKMPKDVGPFKTMFVTLGVEGEYPTLEKLVRWVETNPRMYRIDQIMLDPPRFGVTAQNSYKLQLVIMGVLG